MTQASGDHGQAMLETSRGERQHKRRWLRLLCLLVGAGAALAGALGLIGVLLFSRFAQVMSGPDWWYALRPLELTGVAPRGPLWWLGFFGWFAIGIVGLILMGRGANHRRRPRLVSSLLLMAAVCLATAVMGRALYVRPGKVLNIASVSRLHQLTGLNLPEGTRLVAGRAQAGPVIVVRAQLMLPTAAVKQLASADSGLWPGDAFVEPVDLSTVLWELQRETKDDKWNFSDWWPESIRADVFGRVIFGPSRAPWIVIFIIETPASGPATLYLECRQ